MLWSVKIGLIVYITTETSMPKHNKPKRGNQSDVALRIMKVVSKTDTITINPKPKQHGQRLQPGK